MYCMPIQYARPSPVGWLTCLTYKAYTTKLVKSQKSSKKSYSIRSINTKLILLPKQACQLTSSWEQLLVSRNTKTYRMPSICLLAPLTEKVYLVTDIWVFPLTAFSPFMSQTSKAISSVQRWTYVGVEGGYAAPPRFWKKYRIVYISN